MSDSVCGFTSFIPSIKLQETHRGSTPAQAGHHASSCENPRIVLAGDFNAFSPEDDCHFGKDASLISFFEQLDATKSSARNLNPGAIDYGAIEAVLGHGFIDVVASQRSADSPYVGTFPTRLIDDKDHGPDRRIDFIFVSPNLRKAFCLLGFFVMRQPNCCLTYTSRGCYRYG